MKKIVMIIISIVLCSYSTDVPLGKKVSNVELLDINFKPIQIPSLGEKTLVVFYIDPDVQDINDPLSDAINNEKYSNEKFGAIGIVNCADTWIPNSLIQSRAKKKQKKYLDSVVLLDTEHTLSKNWELGGCNDAIIIIIIGKDSRIKYFKSIKSQEESKAIIPAVLKVIEQEIKFKTE